MENAIERAHSIIVKFHSFALSRLRFPLETLRFPLEIPANLNFKSCITIILR